MCAAGTHAGHTMVDHTFPLSQKVLLDRTGLDPMSSRKWELELVLEEKALSSPDKLRLLSA